MDKYSGKVPPTMLNEDSLPVERLIPPDIGHQHMQEEQTELLTKVNRLTIPVRVFSIGSGVFLLVLVAMLIYQKLNEVQ